MDIRYLGTVEAPIPVDFGTHNNMLSGIISETGSVDARIDWFLMLPGNLLKIANTITAAHSMIFSEQSLFTVLTSNDSRYNGLNATGDVPKLVPGMANIYWFVAGIEGDLNDITDVATATMVYTPRYNLL
jgi:hypothetical protein